MENKFLDYQSWRDSNERLLDFFVPKKSYVISRFKFVLMVVDYLFDKAVNEDYKFDNNEEEMFEVGYRYIFDRFMTINDLLVHVYDNNKEEMEKHSKDINLLFYIEDFIDDLESIDGDTKKGKERLSDLESTILESIENKINIEEGTFYLVKETAMEIYNSLNADYYGIPDIFYEIALEYNLVEEDDNEYIDIDDILEGNI